MKHAVKIGTGSSRQCNLNGKLSRHFINTRHPSLTRSVFQRQIPGCRFQPFLQTEQRFLVMVCPTGDNVQDGFFRLFPGENDIFSAHTGAIDKESPECRCFQFVPTGKKQVFPAPLCAAETAGIQLRSYEQNVFPRIGNMSAQIQKFISAVFPLQRLFLQQTAG